MPLASLKAIIEGAKTEITQGQRHIAEEIVSAISVIVIQRNDENVVVFSDVRCVQNKLHTKNDSVAIMRVVRISGTGLNLGSRSCLMISDLYKTRE